MFYYMRTLAASNPFATASQSLAALFNEIRPRAQNIIMQFQKPKTESIQPHCSGFSSCNPRFQRAEIWIHPIDGQTTVIHGGRRLIHSNNRSIFDAAINNTTNTKGKSIPKSNLSTGDLEVENEDEDDEEAQAEAEEYANTSLIELSKQFGLAFIHAHGKLYTKIGMETFPEVASLTLQALSGLLAQRPFPLSAERLCQLFVVNMFNVDRAASMTNQKNSVKNQINDTKCTNVSVDNFVPSSRLTEIETLRSVHHDHAARFALDTFSLVCRRAAQLLQETPPVNVAEGWLSPDARILLSALCLWIEWMILHPEHWLPPPNHRDPTLRPHLDDWSLVAKLCTQSAAWLSRWSNKPKYEEITPTTSLVLRLKGELSFDEKLDDDDSEKSNLYHTLQDSNLYKAAFLSEEIYYYTGDWDPKTVADFVRIEKLVLFGDYLCGIETPVLNYNIDQGVYESVIQRESSERVQDKRVDIRTNQLNTSNISLENEEKSQRLESMSVLNDDKSLLSEDYTTDSNSGLTDIAALQRQRAFLQKQLDEESRLNAWRRNAIRQAASCGQRAVEIEVRPIYLLPDTNCYIDWLEGIATLAQKSSNYTVLIPIVGNRFGSSSSGGGGIDRPYDALISGDEVTCAGLIQERAKQAISYLEQQFEHRNTRLRALTARGSLMETIAYRNEINGGRAPGQTNDDVILTCCQHFCKEDSDRFQLRNLTHGLGESVQYNQNNQPMRLIREVVLLTSDRNLRLKALNVNIPARPLRTFVSWSRLPLVRINLSNNTLSDPLINSTEKRRLSTSASSSSSMNTTKPQPRGQWKQPLKY
ncbi:Telomerase-binding protein EST1A [Schistosoma japonicum]|nr:Telomerase-binding protein EST1A [Schistosoma japonicum]